ncbi:DMT family transporter [Spiroplasma eriocheiris]|uniref:EamA domain-containing protein n=1 Tax=Spiroplasma eriocheiris TaxID=315358 RepID=A0A0H3XMX8_9MOLU|nr:DMT family transporter [Spiroplasma eriocheiris]AHF57995.1 putative transmembrane protein [Spiroplasma eriocheiris CCTCC M 207170]AKM54437.1 hypothetical protein SERIO_v1c08770 [Spiroplasma eriocheiris]
METKNLEQSKSHMFAASIFGVTSAIFYSLTPLFVFFFAGDNSTKITYAIFLATIQELMSFLLVAFATGFLEWKSLIHNNHKFKNLTYTLVLPFGYMCGVGLYSSIKNLILKLKHLRVWIMAGVGLLAGPISMALLMIAALFLNDGTLGNVILNTAPIYCMIISRVVLKEKINRFGLVGILITTLFTFGMLFNYFFMKEQINWKLIAGVLLSFVAALCYAFEGTISDYFLHSNKIQLSNYEVVSVKSFISFWTMLIIALPIASAIDNQPGYQGWVVFKSSFDLYGWQAILVYVSGIVMGTGRLMYFETVKLSNGTYALATQLTMLIWTPVLQILGNTFISEINVDKLQWYYWVWSALILLGLVIITFNENLNSYYNRWKLKHSTQRTLNSSAKPVKNPNKIIDN